MSQLFGWLLFVLGLIFMFSPWALGEQKHYTGLVGLLLIFLGLTILKKRKDQIEKSNNGERKS